MDQMDQSPMPDDARPSGMLCAEHRVIKRVLWVLQRIVDQSQQTNELPVTPLSNCIEFFRLFADACHHAKEEDFLFPILEKRGIANEGGPIGVMLAEHREGRRLVGQMDAQLHEYIDGNRAIVPTFRQTALAYVQLLTQHIFKEDHTLFVMGDQVMADTDHRRLNRQFCEVGCRQFDGKTQHDLEQLADQLEQQLDQ
jgi:hemerythrin-like domain-containing protein